MQELDLCVAGVRLSFICFDDLQEMHSAIALGLMRRRQ
jgi:hypothetical protein